MTADRTEQVNLRLEEELVRGIERAAQEEALDRATMVRRLLRDGLMGWRTQRAITGYQAGRLSIGRAAEDAGLTQWELTDELRDRHIAHPLSPEEVDEWFRHDEGFTTTIDWMGSAITTLADVPPRQGGILLVGISPRTESIAAATTIKAGWGSVFGGDWSDLVSSRTQYLGERTRPFTTAVTASRTS